MVFASNVFLFLFLPLFFIAYYLIRNRIWRNTILLISSILFYAWGEPLYVFLMIFSIVINYVFAVMIEKDLKGGKKNFFIIIIFINLMLLGFFKYADFIIENLNVVLNINIPNINVPLPIGISFYTFQILSYIIDVYWGKIKVQRNIIYLGTYISSFPQLIAGPIVTYHTIEKEMEKRRENIKDFSSGVRRFIQGLFKKVIVANNVAFVVDTILSYKTEDYGMMGAWIAIISYSLQIYFDFSGYSDMAIGLGRMLGFHFNENFNHPYIAISITDFWRRWHISLTTFFREYIYIPLGGNRASKLKVIRNITIVWLLTGLWHGASWNFVLWGGFFCLFLLLEKYVIGERLATLPVVIKHIYTLLIVIVGWVLFRIESAAEIKTFLGALSGHDGIGRLEFFIYSQILQVKYVFWIIVGILLSTPIVGNIEKLIKSFKYGSGYVDLFNIGLFIFTICQLQISNFNPFIYFQF